MILCLFSGKGSKAQTKRENIAKNYTFIKEFSPIITQEARGILDLIGGILVCLDSDKCSRVSVCAKYFLD